MRTGLPVLIMVAASIIAASALAQPTVTMGDVTFIISSRGSLTVKDLSGNIGLGSLMNWGPAWSWESACSWQDSWSRVSGPTGTEKVFYMENFCRCTYAELQFGVKYWIGTEALVLEVNATATQDSEFAGMSWTFQIPISRFAGKTIYVVLRDGSRVPVNLRSEHVPGNVTLAYNEETAGWIIPADGEKGVVLGVFSDLWPQGVTTAVEDEREWQGTTYALRNWLSQYFTLSEGQTIRAVVYVAPYTGENLDARVNQLLQFAGELSSGSSLTEVKAGMIATLKIEEGAEAGIPYAMVVAVALVAIAVLAALFYVVRARRR